MNLLLNIDVSDLAAATTFYVSAFGLRIARRFDDDMIELLGAAVPIYLLHKAPGSSTAGDCKRSYARHWTPLHCDVVVDDLDAAVARAVAAGAVQEGETRDAAWGRIVQLADPYGHGWCLVQFQNRGYDEIATP
jgi:predicted enzyme related to lactoylglutathione lyase